MSNKIELLAPAGDLEKLKIAIAYGADAVYFGGEDFSLRAAAGNLSFEDMEEGLRIAHKKDVKCYLAFNIYPHDEDIAPMREFLEKIKGLDIDAFIVSDPGAMALLKEYIPKCNIHLSTQANMTNYMTARFWYDQGVKRIVTAREMTLKEIKGIRENIPGDMEIESFVHGAMCISYSGRCLLSNFMVQRDANRGECAHPCRWKYDLVEEERPGEYYPVEEDNRGTYIMNSKDLNMIGSIKDLIDAGVTSFKIEGRMKSVFYLATIIGQYRKAIDQVLSGKDVDESCKKEVAKVSNREFTQGFYYGNPGEDAQNYETNSYKRDYTFTGVVRSYDMKTGFATIEQRNKMIIGDTIEVFGPDMDFYTQKISIMTDEEDAPIEAAPHPQQIIKIKMERPVKADYMLREERTN